MKKMTLWTACPGTNQCNTGDRGQGDGSLVPFFLTKNYGYCGQIISIVQTNRGSSAITVATMAYDGVGNVTNSTLKAYNNTFTKTLQSTSQYTNSGNMLSSVTDSNGSTTAYEYYGNQNKMYGVPSRIIDAAGNTINQNIDNYGRIAQMTFYAKDKVAQSGNLQYNYNDKFQLESIARSINYGFEKYLFQYDDFGNMTGIIIGNSATATGKVSLVTYQYGAGNGPLVKQTYGNNDYVSYTYDNLGRTATATYSDGRVLTYAYNGEGMLHSIHDSKENVIYLYVYDSIGRLINSVKNNTANSSMLLRTQQQYNDSNQLVGQNWQIGTTSYSEGYTYNEADGSLNTMTTATGQTINHTYDALRRLSSVNNGQYTYTYTYRDISTTQTTTQVEKLSYSGITGALDFRYTYDELGNIKTYTDFNGSQSYTYDGLGQLTQAVVGSTTYSYAYDFCGNITSANGHTYTYGNTQWKDLLTAYDGQAISYDGSGNPTSYYNGTRWTFGWEEGRNLVSASSNNKTISYAYDHEGVRTSKTVGSEKHNYIYASGKLLRETFGTTVIDFFYDANGRPYAMTQGGATYYYVLNLQGDVMGVMDSSGNLVAKYKYDPYGNILSTTGSKADIYNPLRYRGYYYDTESTLYYLQSRYYDPAMGRFINADDYPTTGQGLTGNNMFAYCGNNPTSRADQSGKLWNYVIGAVVGGVVSAVTTAVQSYKETGEVNWQSTIIAGVVGAVGGAVAASGLNFLAQAGITMAATAAGDVLTQKVDSYTTGAKYNPMRTIHNTLLAGGCSILGSGLGSLASYGQTALGSELLEKGAEKAGQAFCRSNLGLSSSKLVQQAEKLIRQGNILTNIGRGISSVTGTLLTWGVSVEYSY